MYSYCSAESNWICQLYFTILFFLKCKCLSHETVVDRRTADWIWRRSESRRASAHSLSEKLQSKLKYLEAEPKILGVREPLSLYSWTADRFVCLFVLLKTWMGKSVTIEYLMGFFYCNFFSINYIHCWIIKVCHIFDEVSYANQGCIYFIKKKYRRTLILWNKIAIFYVNIFENWFYSCYAKQNFEHHYSSLQCPIILQKSFLNAD